MEFWGFIFDTRYEGGSFLSSFRQNTDHVEYPINSETTKKYYANGKWIFSTTQEYLKTIDLKKYIKRSDKFAKIQFSTDSGILSLIISRKENLRNS